MSAASAEPAPAWRPDNPRVHPVRVLAAWAISALALLLAASIVPGADIRGVGGAIVVAALVAVVNAIIPPILAALRLPFTIGIGFIAVLAADAVALLIAADAAAPAPLRRRVRQRARRLDRRLRRQHGGRRDRRHRRRLELLVPGRAPRGAPHRHAGRDGRAGDHLPRDRRPRPPGAAPRDPRRHDAGDGALARRRQSQADRVGDRSLLADGREPGGDPARRQPRHPRVPVGRQGLRAGGHLLEARGLRGDRGIADGRAGAALRRRDEPREPALGQRRRGDPDREPDRRGQARQPRLPRVPRQRRQRHADARALPPGDRHRADRRRPPAPPRRAPARSPRRDLPAAARRDVRVRPRPRRVLGAPGHVPRRAGRLRDVPELRRGGPPLRTRASRHIGGAPQARRALRADRARRPLRAAAVRDRRALRPRADPGRDLQAAQRLRARRARAPLAQRRRRARAGGGRRERRRHGAGARRGDRPRRGGAGRHTVRGREGGRGARLGQPRPRLPDGAPAPAHARGDRRAAP